MAILKLYNDIQTAEEKNLAKWWGEIEGTSFDDVAAFCEALPANDPKIELQLHSNGGNVTEGWSIYDRLRATGKEIHAIVEGKAASMATVIMMAAPKANRKSYENAEILIHNPYMLTGGAFTADDLARLEKEMRTDQEKILNLYVDRCSDEGDDEEKRQALREELQKVMDENIYITPARAKELGIISEIIPPKSAKAGQSSTKKNKKAMTKQDETTEVKQSLLDRMLAKLGFKSIEDVKFGMDLNTADGSVITVEREEGEPQVGDKASPDGEHKMPDGSTIVVEEGVITEIKPAGAEEGDDDGNGGKGDDEGSDEEIKKLQDRIKELEDENEDLKKQLEEAQKNAKSVEDMATLNAIKMAGGAEKVLALAKGNYKPQKRDARQTGKPAVVKGGMEEELQKLKEGKLKNVNGKYVDVEEK